METIPAAAVEDVINFFEDLGTSLRAGYLNRYAVWSMFCDDAVRYWSAIGEAYARECREDEQRSQEYAEFQWMVHKLKRIDVKKGTGRAEPLDAQTLREFLEYEAQLDQPIVMKSGISV